MLVLVMPVFGGMMILEMFQQRKDGIIPSLEMATVHWLVVSELLQCMNAAVAGAYRRAGGLPA